MVTSKLDLGALTDPTHRFLYHTHAHMSILMLSHLKNERSTAFHTYLPAHSLEPASANPTIWELWDKVFSNSESQSFHNRRIQPGQTLQTRRPEPRHGTTDHPLKQGERGLRHCVACISAPQLETAICTLPSTQHVCH